MANGHIYPDIARTGTSTYRQRNQMLKHLPEWTVPACHRRGRGGLGHREVVPRRRVWRL
jgi:hypothetical protein